MTNNNQNIVYAFSDGSAIGNPGPGGYGAVLKYGDNVKEFSQGFKHTTNNRMELLGAITALDALKALAASARVGWNPYLCNPKLRERLYRVSVPTLIVWGESDRFVPHAHGKAYQDGIAGAQFVPIKDCGHAPPFEKPEETVRALVDFFNA